ncbi:MAG: hypothetical protein FJ225_09035 [Lentisphaerae bacterium]|nr:hypothetical protein [Lentisphaerota bacterium]
MKRTALATAALALFGAGCVKVNQTLTINKNGSATYELSYDIAEQTVQQMKAMFTLRDQMMSLSGESVAAPQLDPRVRAFFDPEQLALTRAVQEYAKYGVSLERIRVESRRGVREVRLKANINQLAALAVSDLFPDYGFSLTKDAKGNYEIYRVPGKFGQAAPVDMDDPETQKMLQPFFAGFKVVTKIQASGQILESNAENDTRYSSVWSFDYDRDTEAFLKLQREPMRMVFDGRGANITEFKQGL